ncbi:hypothetical protein HanRHA438_Chr17g0831981 [Helianthus annuus]|nr:hypothetical protein HanRHA438_Chr17g0831981 [Helianthus annuus]
MNESRNRLNGTCNCTRFGLDSRKGEKPLSYGSDGEVCFWICLHSFSPVLTFRYTMPTHS